VAILTGRTYLEVALLILCRNEFAAQYLR